MDSLDFIKHPQEIRRRVVDMLEIGFARWSDAHEPERVLWEYIPTVMPVPTPDGGTQLQAMVALHIQVKHVIVGQDLATVSIMPLQQLALAEQEQVAEVVNDVMAGIMEARAQATEAPETSELLDKVKASVRNVNGSPSGLIVP